jgi:hypothetical protein
MILDHMIYSQEFGKLTAALRLLKTFSSFSITRICVCLHVQGSY